MLDDRVRAVLARLEAEDADERARGVPREQRARQVARTTGQFLFAFVAPQTDCEVLEIGGSRGYSSIWLGAGVRYLGGRVLSLENDPAKVEALYQNGILLITMPKAEHAKPRQVQVQLGGNGKSS